MTTTDTPTLDDAWAAAEAALPEGWRLYEVQLSGHRWVAGAGRIEPVFDGRNSEVGHGPAPKAALLALAERLQENRDD